MFANRATGGASYLHKRPSFLIVLLLFVAASVLLPAEHTRAQDPSAASPADFSSACYAQVRLGYWADILRGPSYELYGIKRTIPAEQEVRVLGRDDSDDWVQVYYPRTDLYGWMRTENLLLYGACQALALATDNLEPEGPPPAVPRVPAPAFAATARFTADERVFWVNEAVVYVLHDSDDVRAHIVLLDMHDERLRFSTALTGEPGRTMGTVSEIAAATGAFIALNGDFWTRNRMPQNLMLQDGALLTAPTNRATFALSAERTPFIGSFTDAWTWDASLIAENGNSIPLQLLNTGCDDAWVCLYTDIYDTLPLWTGYDGLRLLLNAEREVVSMAQNLPLEIPAEHLVVRTGASSAAAAWLRDNVALGDTLAFSFPTEPDWRNFEHAIGGGPLLVDDGAFWQDCDPDQPDDERVCENFDLNFRLNQYGNSLQARSAIGYSADNTLIMVMVEGNDVYGSQGITQRDLADIFLRMGAERAMEFDGGRSSALWVGRNLVNGVTLAAGERNVTNALLVFWEDTP